jgi:ribosome-associated protein
MGKRHSTGRLPPQLSEEERAARAAEHEEWGPSKSQRKRDADRLQELGESLIALKPAELAALPLPESLFDAVSLAQRISAHGGLYRQKQLIGKLMRNLDVEPIAAAINARRDSRDTASRVFHRLEQWRDRLLVEGEEAVVALGPVMPQADLDHVRRLVAEAARETTAGRSPTAARALFRYLRELPPNL